MNRKDYIEPAVFPVFLAGIECVLASSGADEYHEGGGGSYGEGDKNHNPFVY